MKKILKLLFLIHLMFIILIITPFFVSGQQISKDVSVEIVLNNQLNIFKNYTKLLLIKNHNDTPHFNDNLKLQISWNLKNSNYNKTFFINKSINYYSSSGMGFIYVKQEGNYSFCANITSLNFYDSNMNNNYLCKTLNFIENKINLSENTTLNNTLDTLNNTFNNTVNITNNTNNTNNTNQTNNNITNNTNRTNNTNNTNQTNNTTNNTNTNRTNNNTTNNNTNNNTTNNTTNQTNNNTQTNNNEENNICSCNLNIYTPKEIINSKDSVYFYINNCNESSTLKSLTTYWIEDLSGNILKNKINTTSKSKKSYTPHFEKEIAMLIKAKNTCNKSASKLIVFKGTVQKTEPFLDVETPSIINAKKTFYVTLSGYKGTSGKTLISVSVKKNDTTISKITKTYILMKNEAFKIKLPITLNDNIISGRYDLVAEGINFFKIKRMEIINNNKTNLDKKTKKNYGVKQNIEKRSTKNLPQIISFYTRQKKFTSNILIYINTKNVQNCSLKIRSNVETKTIIPKNGTNSINISINESNETIISNLNCISKNYSTKLILNLTKDLIKKNAITGQITALNKIQKNTTENSYEITNNKTQSTTTRKIDKTNTFPKTILFIFLGISGVTLLFKKEIFNFIQKTKLFKSKKNSLVHERT